MDRVAEAIDSSFSGGAVRDLARSGETQSQLLAAVAAGDRAAAERLVESSYQGVYAFLRRLCGDGELAADLTQDTFRRAWDALPGFHGQAQFSTWLCRIAYNTFLNHLRRPRRLVPLDERHADAVHDPLPLADETLGAAVEGDRLRRAVLGLPEEQRFTVTALYWGERSVREIAAAEGVSGVAIRKRLKRALSALSRALEAAEVAR
jgi:RNA polymerase sigma-70 factor (ECF subfamily)